MAKKNPNRDMITVALAAMLLGKTEHTVYRYTYDGKLKSYRNASGRVRLDRREVLRFKAGLREFR